jgi:peptidoglycan/xylan/chitin deacetylase (PgdA/CDA1 family)
VNGWKVSVEQYLTDINEATKSIHSSLFRPPYGRIRFNAISKVKSLIALRAKEKGIQTETKIVMWDVLSGDFDAQLSPEKCLQNVLKHADNGSIIVFHDSAKAWKRMEYALPKLLDFYTQLGYEFKTIPE